MRVGSKHRKRKIMALSMAAAVLFNNVPYVEIFHIPQKIEVQAADTTKTIDASATVQQIDASESNRPGIPDGTLLNELKRLVNTSLGRQATQDITYGELMAYEGEIDLSSIGSQITSIRGLGYARKAKRIVLTNVPVTAIEDYEFDGCKGLVEIVLPNTLKSIGKFSFRNCSQLNLIELPETVTTIDESAFDSCISLEALKFPDAIAVIGKGAFSGCVKLSKATITNGKVKLGASVFEGCVSLRSMVLPEGITEIPASFFSGSGLESFQVPTSVTSINQAAFYGTHLLKTMDLSQCKMLSVIDTEAFTASGIVSIVLPSNLRQIKTNAFSYTNLTEITIPDSVQGTGELDAEGGIQAGAFQMCASLQKVSLPAGIFKLQDELFSGCGNLSEIEIRNAEASALESVGEKTFKDCISLGNTDFLSKLTKLVSIGKNAFQSTKEAEKDTNYFGEKVYVGGLKSICLPDSLTSLASTAFAGQYNVESVDFGDGLKEIPENIFCDRVKLTQVTLPGTLKSIGDSAFLGCYRLEKIKFPNTLETIGAAAFSGCGKVFEKTAYYHMRYIKKSEISSSRPNGDTSLTELLIFEQDKERNQSLNTIFVPYSKIITPDAYNKLSETEQAGYELYYIIAEKRYAKASDVYTTNESTNTQYTNYIYDEKSKCITGETYVYSDCLASGEDGIYYPKEGYTGYFVRGALSFKVSLYTYLGLPSLELPNSVKSVGEKAFYDCIRLSDITLSNQMTEIPKNCFAVSDSSKLYRYDCFDEKKSIKDGLYTVKRSVTLPKEVQDIEDGAFQNNVNMTIKNGDLPATVVTIGNSAFAECKSLKKITIPSTTTTIGDYAFAGCTYYELLDKENKIYYISEDGLSEIDLSQASSLGWIGTYAFSKNPIKQCIIPDGVTIVSQGLFADCSYLTKVICSDNTEAIKADVFSNCASLISITVPAKATISYNAFRGHVIGNFSMSVTEPDPISVSIGKSESLPINCFLADYLRDSLVVKEKSGSSRLISIENVTSEELNGWNIAKANVKGVQAGTTQLSVTGTNNYFMYKGTEDIVVTKTMEVTITLNVTEKKCESIEDRVSSVVMSVDNQSEQVRLTPQVLPEDCSEANVWSNANDSVVNVLPDTYSKNGALVTAASAILVPKALGTSRVQLQVGSIKKNYQVHVVVPATSLSLDQHEISLKEGVTTSAKLHANMSYDTTKHNDKDWSNNPDIVEFSSSDESVVTVSATGKIQVVGAGVANVTATALGSGKSDTCTVKVLPDETMVYFTDEKGNPLDSSKKITVDAKEKITLNIATEPVDSLNELKYEFSDADMFTFVESKTRLVETEDKGTQEKVISMTFEAQKPGTGTITVLPVSYKNKDAVAATVSVKVLAPVIDAQFAAGTIVEAGTKKSMFGYITSQIGKTDDINEVAKFTTDTITFSSSDPSVATIDPKTGILTALKTGKVTVKMQILNDQNLEQSIIKTVDLEVVNAVATQIVVSEKQNKNAVPVGGTLQLQVAYLPVNAVDSVTYTSLYPDIAKVDQKGVIVGLKQGTGVIVVTSAGKGLTYNFSFTVSKGATTTRTSVAKVKSVKVQNQKGKKAKVSWKKISGVSGYRIVYATNKKFTSGKKIVSASKSSTSKVISKLKKGKTYYFKVQAYKTVSGKKVYGKYSSVTKVKIKK